MPKMRWCFTRFRHAARTARGGPKCVGASLGLGWPRVRDSLLSFLVLDQDIVAAHVRGVFLRADATQVWVARGVVAFFAVYILKCILHRSQ